MTWGADASKLPVNVPPNLSNVIAVAAGDWHTLALKADGRVVTWGSRNLQGQLDVPANLSNVVAVAAGSTHSIALKADGTVVGWGKPGGALPNPPPAGLTNVVMISAEGWHSLALRSDGTVLGWGSPWAPTNALLLRDVSSVAAGFRHSIALTNNGKLHVWGDSVLTNLAGIDGVISVASGDYHCVILSPENFGPSSLTRNQTLKADVDSTLTLTGRDPNGDALTYTITSLPTNGLIFQHTGIGRGEPIVSPGPVSDALGRIIFVPPISAAGVDYDSVGFTASDGYIVSSPATIRINVAPMPVMEAIGFSGDGADPNFSFSFQGVPNLRYYVFSSPNLTAWSQIASTQSVSGDFTIVDRSVTNQAVRFYRIRTQ